MTAGLKRDAAADRSDHSLSSTVVSDAFQNIVHDFSSVCVEKAVLRMLRSPRRATS